MRGAQIGLTCRYDTCCRAADPALVHQIGVRVNSAVPASVAPFWAGLRWRVPTGAVLSTVRSRSNDLEAWLAAASRAL